MLLKAAVLPIGQSQRGETLEALAQKHQVAEHVIARLSNFMDAEALRAMADGVSLNLDTLEQAAACAPALQAKLRELNTTGIPAEVTAEFDVRTDKPILRISRRHHGNIKSSVLTQDFVHGADYAALATAADTFRGLLGEGAKVMRGEGDIATDFASLAAEFPTLSMGSYPFTQNGAYGTNLVVRGTDPALVDAAMIKLTRMFG